MSGLSIDGFWIVLGGADDGGEESECDELSSEEEEEERDAASHDESLSCGAKSEEESAFDPRRIFDETAR